MPKKNFSIIIVPHQGKMYNKKVSYSLVYSLVLSVVFFIGLGAFSIFSYLSNKLDRNNLYHYQMENKALEKKIVDLDLLLTQLKNQMNNLMEKDQTIRLVFGLPEVDASVREVGVGGPNLNISPYHTEAGKKLKVTENELDKVLRQTRFERESLDSIYSELVERKQILDHTPSISPTDGYLSRGFGVRADPFTGSALPHLGIDLAADKGTPVFATANGKVLSAGWQGALGNLIVIDHGFGYQTHYGHLATMRVRAGQVVKRGEIIGLVGNTGYSTGPHLHYEVHLFDKPVDPQKYILAGGIFFD
jgi:murein DD-endopeptidase MepM/ murein hydrolase activator NlpD